MINPLLPIIELSSSAYHMICNSVLLSVGLCNFAVEYVIAAGHST